MSVKEVVKKGENIELYVEIPQTFEEDTIKINSIIELESTSGKKLELETNIILTTIPISVLISCNEYKLIKQKMDYDNNVTFEQCFKLDTNELLGDEEINFELLNYKNDDSIEFYLSVKSLDNNTSNKPEFLQIKQKNKFKISIPKYDFSSNDKEIPRLNCILEIFINKNFIIYIIIDSLIRPNLNEIKMYDYYSKSYVENESIIYLNEVSQDILIKEKLNIELRFILFSTQDNTPFEVFHEYSSLNGIHITPYKGIIQNQKSKFSLFLDFDNNSIIQKNAFCRIKIIIGINHLEFKIKFQKPNDIPFCDDYFKHFSIKGKNNLSENWIFLNEISGETKFYVTPFNCSNNEINISNIKDNKNNIKDLIFYNINNNGFINKSDSYLKKIDSHWYSSNINFDITFCFKYNNFWYPLIKNKGKLDHWKEIYFEDWKEIKRQVCEDFYKWRAKIMTTQNAFAEISKLNDFHLFDKRDYFYKECEKILGTIDGIAKFKNEVYNIYYNNTNNKKGEITFESLAYHIIYNTRNCLYKLNDILPKEIQEILEYDFNGYRRSSDKNEQELYLYNYILKLSSIFEQKEDEFNRNKKSIIINDPNIKNEQKNLLLSYYSIRDKNDIDYKPKLIMNYEKQFRNFNKEIEKNEETKSQKYLIIGNECKEVNINEKPKYEDDNKNSSNLKLDNSISIVLPEIKLSIYKEKLSLNSICELFNKCIIGSRIFPAYLQTAITNENEENLKNAKNYFEILYSMYKNKKEEDNSIINEKSNEFISSFQDMIVKLNDAGINFKGNKDLSKIKQNINNKNSFIKTPEKIEPNKQKDQWENKKILEQKIEQDFQKEMMKKIEFNNIKTEQLKNIDINMSIIRNNNDTLNSLNESINNITKIEDNEEEIKFDEIFNEFEKDEDIFLSDESDDKKIDKKIIAFSSSDKGKDNLLKKTSREDFDNLEKKFNEDYALKYIVDKMKNKVNKNDYIFKYELLKSEIKGYIPNKNNLYHNIDSQLKENEKLYVSTILENSKFLTSKIIATVSQINFNDGTDEILFNKLEANIIIDLARTISNENRFFNMLMVCGLAYALYSLKIHYTLNIIGDSDMKVRIKRIDEPHSELILQKLYDCCFIKRNVTQLPTCLKYFIDNYPPKDETINRVYYIFTNGFDDELKKFKAWQSKIFNNTKNSFSFIFTKSQVLEKPTNIEYKKFFEEIWDEFAEESKKSMSYVTVTKISFKDIDKLDNLTENLSKVLLREKDPSNKDTSPKFTSLFNIDKSSVLTKKYIDLFRSLISDQLNKPEFNELYIRKNKMPYIYDNQKDNQKQFKIFCQRTGKIIRYDKLNIETQRNILSYIIYFKIIIFLIN